MGICCSKLAVRSASITRDTWDTQRRQAPVDAVGVVPRSEAGEDLRWTPLEFIPTIESAVRLSLLIHAAREMGCVGTRSGEASL